MKWVMLVHSASQTVYKQAPSLSPSRSQYLLYVNKKTDTFIGIDTAFTTSKEYSRYVLWISKEFVQNKAENV